MKTNYWFPRRPPSRGWGWGLPIAWQGWAVLMLFFGGLIAGCIYLAPFGQLTVIAFGIIMAIALLLIAVWKGEPPRPD